MYEHKTPPSSPKNTPFPGLNLKVVFPGLNLKVGKMNYSLGNSDPNSAKCLKSLLEVDKKKFIQRSDCKTWSLPFIMCAQAVYCIWFEFNLQMFRMLNTTQFSNSLSALLTQLLGKNPEKGKDTWIQVQLLLWTLHAKLNLICAEGLRQLP